MGKICLFCVTVMVVVILYSWPIQAAMTDDVLNSTNLNEIDDLDDPCVYDNDVFTCQLVNDDHYVCDFIAPFKLSIDLFQSVQQELDVIAKKCTHLWKRKKMLRKLKRIGSKLSELLGEIQKTGQFHSYDYSELERNIDILNNAVNSM